MAAKKQILSVEDIKRIQKELFELRILERYNDYKVSEKYLSDFLKNYSRLYGENDYIIGSFLIPLFKRLQAKYPDMDEQEMVKKTAMLIPVIRAMFEYEGIFKLIKKVQKIAK